MLNKELDYSLIADCYDVTRALSPQVLGFWLSKIIDLGNLSQNSTVLDIGCGTGMYTIPLAGKTSAIVYGLDNAKKMIEKAKAKKGGYKVRWIVGNAENLPFEDACFDCVFMTLVIHQIGNKKKTINEIHRVLKKKGRLAIMTKSHGQLRKSTIWDFPKVKSIDAKRFPTIPILKQTVFEAGFKNVCHHVISGRTASISVDEYLEKTKKKFLSTLTLLSEEDFQKGLKIFEKKLREKYGKKITYENEYTFVVSKK